MFLIGGQRASINTMRCRLSTEVQLVVQIRESERISFSKECIVPTITLTGIKYKSQR